MNSLVSQWSKLIAEGYTFQSRKVGDTHIIIARHGLDEIARAKGATWLEALSNVMNKVERIKHVAQ